MRMKPAPLANRRLCPADFGSFLPHRSNLWCMPTLVCPDFC
jgi:hypothetical protein